jgi:transcriptional regulator with XRE-family HTH domain
VFKIKGTVLSGAMPALMFMELKVEQYKVETFGTRLRRMRYARDRSAHYIAARARISESYLQRIEGGTAIPPSACTIIELARALCIDADQLFILSDRIPPDLEYDLARFPLLFLAARVIQTWGREQIISFLLSNGVDREKIAAWDFERDVELDGERSVRREPITRELKMLIAEKDNYECVYCSAQAVLQVDHVYPYSLGGTNEPENLVTCCDKCNRKKQARTQLPPMVFGRFRNELEGMD